MVIFADAGKISSLKSLRIVKNLAKCHFRRLADVGKNSEFDWLISIELFVKIKLDLRTFRMKFDMLTVIQSG